MGDGFIQPEIRTALGLLRRGWLQAFDPLQLLQEEMTTRRAQKIRLRVEVVDEPTSLYFSAITHHDTFSD